MPRGRSCNESERQTEVRFASQWTPQELSPKKTCSRAPRPLVRVAFAAVW